MVKREKIEEWIKEVESRPDSAPLIVQYLGNRLRDLTARNEEILAELIALQSEKRVEEYERRIAHLEYQLDLIRRQGEGMADYPANLANSSAKRGVAQKQFSLFVYDGLGHLLKLALSRDDLQESRQFGIIQNDFQGAGEASRLVVVEESEELLFVFSSGRIHLTPASALPAFSREKLGGDSDAADGIELPWQIGPVKPHAGERLVGITPVSNLARADCFIQASRRGFLKKIRSGMAGSIFENRYIGAGIKKPPDQTLEIILAKNEDQIVLVTSEGYLIALEVKSLPVSIEEVIRLDSSDHLVACFIDKPDHSILVITNGGKILQLTNDRIEPSDSFKTKGQAIFSGQRRAQGVRVIGAASVKESDWGVVMDVKGKISLHSIRQLTGFGTVASENQPIAFAAIHLPQEPG